MDRNLRAVILACFILAAFTVPMFASDDSSAEQVVEVDGVRMHCFSDSVSLKAGGDTSVTIVLYNSNAYTYEVDVSSSIEPSSRVSSSISEYSRSLDTTKSETFTVTVSANSTAVSGDYTVTVTLAVWDVNNDSEKQTGTMTFPVRISSNYSSEGYYNKIMGVIESPFDDPILTALITLGIWIGIAIVMDTLLALTLLFKTQKVDNPELKKDAKSAGFFLMILMLLIGIPISIRVSGIDERIIATVSDFIYVVICLNVAYLVWKIYKVLMYNVIIVRDRNDRIDDSLYPLVKMIGKIIITVITLSVIMSVYGLSLTAIITSAGLATLAISLGAQSTLNQFFCGLVLLITRPFRIGDKVRLGTSTEVLIVRKIGVMETEFKVWLNEEVQHIPNSTVMSSSIVNITKGDKCYKVVDYIDIDYSADIDKVRDIIMSILTVHPKIVNDGSKSAPDFRVSSLEASSIRIRISYIVYDHEVWHAVSCQIKEAIYKKFLVEGIKVPHNIVDVHTE